MEAMAEPEQILGNHSVSPLPLPSWDAPPPLSLRRLLSWLGMAANSLREGSQAAEATDAANDAAAAETQKKSNSAPVCSVDNGCVEDKRTISSIEGQLSKWFNVERSASAQGDQVTLEDTVILIGEKDHEKNKKQHNAVQLLYKPGDHLLVESPEKQPAEKWCYGVSTKQRGSGGCYGIDTSPARLKADSAFDQWKALSREAVKAIDRLNPRWKRVGDKVIDKLEMTELTATLNEFSATSSDSDYMKVQSSITAAWNANANYNNTLKETTPGREKTMDQGIDEHAKPGRKTITVLGGDHIGHMKARYLNSAKKVLVLEEK